MKRINPYTYNSTSSFYNSYLEWRKLHKEDSALIDIVDKLLTAAIKETCRFSVFSKDDAVEEKFDHIQQLSFYSIEQFHKGYNYTNNSYNGSNCYYLLRSSNCINCVILSLLFGISDKDNRYILVIEDKFINEFDWMSLKALLPYTYLEHIFIIVDEYMADSTPISPLNMPAAKVWDVVYDDYYAIILKDESYVERESGYEIDISVIRHKYVSIPETPKMKDIKSIWLSRPRLSYEEASKDFFIFYERLNSTKSEQPSVPDNTSLSPNKKTIQSNAHSKGPSIFDYRSKNERIALIIIFVILGVIFFLVFLCSIFHIVDL